ncbi:MAG: antitoxin VbhA family protein [Acetobacteraceae bacterium]|nr:antitoxin VbhA family protein [Acetobacteraceae bacterium]
MNDVSTSPNPTAAAKITPEERARRQAADDYARGSLRLEGFTPSKYSDELTRRFIAGEMTREALLDALRAHHGL